MSPRIRVRPCRGLRGRIKVPGDKSISHRAVLLGSVAEGVTEVHGFLRAEDTLNTLGACRELGVAVEEEGDRLRIRGRGLRGLKEPVGVLDLGNAGTGIRLLAGLLAGQDLFAVLTGDAYLRRRPMGRITRPLTAMGASILGRDRGRLAPLAVQGGRLRGMEHASPVASAQVKSALLLAGLNAEGTTVVTEPHPSRDHTERMLRGLGYDVRAEAGRVSLEGGGRLRGASVRVPGDFSSAAFFLVAAMIVEGSEVEVLGVGVNPTRTGLLAILDRMGGGVDVEPVEEDPEPVADLAAVSARLRGTSVEGAEVPAAIDEFPILCVAAALAQGETRIRGAEELRVKETDRIRAMARNLAAVGGDVEERPDGLVIRGVERLRGGRVESFGDHRVAMAMAVAGCCSREGVTVEGTGCVATSFPGFVETLRSLGGDAA